MLEKVLQNNMCAGCGLCESAFGSDKLKVEMNKEGFFRPNLTQNLTAEETEAFVQFCPGTKVKKEILPTPNYDGIWGEIYSSYIGASSDEKIRSEASSGGGISTILVYLLEKKIVDAVIHVGASLEDPFMNVVKLSTTKEQVISNANSRYSPSSPLKNINEIVESLDFNSYAFVGKPCDVAALRQYSEINPLVKEKVKYMISFFCAGVPSIKATKDTVEALAVDTKEVKRVDYRKEGWPGFFRVIDKNDKKYKLTYALTWMRLLGPRVQFRCKVCPDGIGHFSDIVCADGWDNFDNKGFPTFKNSPGKSLIISRTIKGEDLLQAAISDDYLLKLNEIKDIRLIDQMQPGQMYKKQYHFVRRIALFIKTGHVLKTNKEFYRTATFTKGPKAQLKNFVGTFKRIKKA